MAKKYLRNPASKVGVELKDMSPIQRLRMAIDQEAYHFIQTLEGKLLTLIDATYSDREQREAAKDMIRQTIWNVGFSAAEIAIQFSEKFEGKTIVKDSRSGYMSDTYPKRNHFHDL